jgi:hypothetical protein
MSGPCDEQIAAMYRAGETDTKVIAAEVGLSTRSVCRALVRTGVRDLKALKTRRTDVDERVIAMLEDGASYADTAETFGFDVGWLREHVPGYGWNGHIAGTIARALKDPRVRQLHAEIRRIPLADAERIIYSERKAS